MCIICKVTPTNTTNTSTTLPTLILITDHLVTRTRHVSDVWCRSSVYYSEKTPVNNIMCLWWVWQGEVDPSPNRNIAKPCLPGTLRVTRAPELQWYLVSRKCCRMCLVSRAAEAGDHRVPAEPGQVNSHTGGVTPGPGRCSVQGTFRYKYSVQTFIYSR